MNHEMSEEVVDPSCGLHMSCTSSFANFGTHGDQLDQGMLTKIPLLHTHAYKAFSVVGPRAWNSLKISVRSAVTKTTFCEHLKTHLSV